MSQFCYFEWCEKVKFTFPEGNQRWRLPRFICGEGGRVLTKKKKGKRKHKLSWMAKTHFIIFLKQNWSVHFSVYYSSLNKDFSIFVQHLVGSYCLLYWAYIFAQLNQKKKRKLFTSLLLIIFYYFHFELSKTLEKAQTH